MIFVNNTRMSLKQLVASHYYEMIGVGSALPVGYVTHPYIGTVLTILLAIVTGAAGALGGFLMKRVIKYTINKYQQWQQKKI